MWHACLPLCAASPRRPLLWSAADSTPRCCRVPPAAGEFAYWLGPSVDVLPYYGPVAARAVMHDHELWLHPSSLEGRGLPRPTLAERVSRAAPRCATPCCALLATRALPHRHARAAQPLLLPWSSLPPRRRRPASWGLHRCPSPTWC